jgi:hypothetical protein
MRAAVLEDDPRTGHQVFDRARGEDLAGTGQSSDTRADVHGKAADVVAHAFALPGVNAGSDLEAGLAETVPNRNRAADCARRPVERGEEPVTGRCDLLPAEMFELATHGRVMLLE